MINEKGSNQESFNASPVDFAIVTALKIERDAVLSRLECVQKIQHDLEPYTYYRGRVEIPGSNEHYEVVLVMLIEMGNSEAATATTQLIERWHPSAIIMVGIAGGVEEKVALGDVVIASFVHYYEPGKLVPGGEQRRPQQSHSDRLLYGRALAYDASEWKGEIGVSQPGIESVTIHLPDAHFGAIGSGENVIADEIALARLTDECPKMLAVAMEGAGVARAAANGSNRPRFLEVRGICDFANSKKNDDWHSFAAGAAASFTIGFLRSCPLPPQSKISFITKEKKTALVLTAQSLRPISIDELLPSFGSDLKRLDLNTVSLDFTDLIKDGMLADPAEAARRLINPRGKLLEALTTRADSELVFHGLVHIPLAVLTGHLVSDRQPVRLFDFHPSPGSNTWTWPDDGASFPSVNVEDLPISDPEGIDAVIRFSVSYEVSAAGIETIVPNPLFDIDIRVAKPERNIIRSEAQARAYGNVFRRVIDRFAQGRKMPRLIHLFYSGPVSLAFNLGQQISENMHPPVIVWNYRQGYEWGINLTAAISGEKCVVYPNEFLEHSQSKSVEDKMFQLYANLIALAQQNAGDAFMPEPGSEDHKLAEKMVERGMLERVPGIPWYYSLPGRIRLQR